MSVVVPTYRRPAALDRCLDGLDQQTMQPLQVLVVRRADDGETPADVARSGVEVVSVGQWGVLAAIEAGARRAAGDIVAFVDDDAVPAPDWIERVRAAFADDAVGAVGGRDVLPTPDADAPETNDVGRLTRWGKVVGNHHRGVGPMRDVHVLKGVNMAFRRTALAIPRGLRGRGAQVNFEVAMCLWAQRRGWRIVYDPAIVVDHYPGERFDADRRRRPEARAVRAAAYNSVAALLATERQLVRRRALYGLLIGDRGTPGIIRALVGLLERDGEPARRLLPSLAGQIDAFSDHISGRRIELEPLERSAPEPRRILFTVPWGERLGGAEQMLFTFLRHVDRSRLEPLVVFFERGSFPREVSALGCPTHVLEVGRLRQPLKFLHSVRALARIVAREQPEVVVNWIAKAHLYGSPAAALAGLRGRTVWWQHLIPTGHWLDRAATALPARAVGCSSHASALAQRRLLPRRATFVVHPGIDPPARADPAELCRLRESLAIPDGVFVAGMVGRLEPGKGHDRFVAAVGLLRKRSRPVHGLLIGSDAYGLAPEYSAQLRRLLADGELAGHVTLTGQVRQAAAYVQLMDVFVSASENESFGLGLLEAMALRVAVVAVNAGGPREIVEHERSGVLVPTGRPEHLAAGVERLMCDPRLRTRVARMGSERARTAFSAGRMTRRLEAELELLRVQ